MTCSGCCFGSLGLVSLWLRIQRPSNALSIKCAVCTVCAKFQICRYFTWTDVFNKEKQIQLITERGDTGWITRKADQSAILSTSARNLSFEVYHEGSGIIGWRLPMQKGARLIFLAILMHVYIFRYIMYIDLNIRM